MTDWLAHAVVWNTNPLCDSWIMLDQPELNIRSMTVLHKRILCVWLTDLPMLWFEIPIHSVTVVILNCIIFVLVYTIITAIIVEYGFVYRDQRFRKKGQCSSIFRWTNITLIFLYSAKSSCMHSLLNLRLQAKDKHKAHVIHACQPMVCFSYRVELKQKTHDNTKRQQHVMTLTGDISDEKLIV